MYSKTTNIINPTGIHARPAADFVGAAGKFKSNITIQKVGSTRGPANAKSIIFVLSQGLTKGSVVEIAADGEDEVAAVDTLIALVDSGFGEV